LKTSYSSLSFQGFPPILQIAIHAINLILFVFHAKYSEKNNIITGDVIIVLFSNLILKEFNIFHYLFFCLK
jgi:hypothetical protein